MLLYNLSTSIQIRTQIYKTLSSHQFLQSKIIQFILGFSLSIFATPFSKRETCSHHLPLFPRLPKSPGHNRSPCHVVSSAPLLWPAVCLASALSIPAMLAFNLALQALTLTRPVSGKGKLINLFLNGVM